MGKYRLDGIVYWKDGNTIYESKNPDSPIGEILVTGEVKWLIEDFEELHEKELVKMCKGENVKSLEERLEKKIMRLKL